MRGLGKLIVGVAVVALIATASGCTSTPTVDATVLDALRPVCRAQGVASAGVVSQAAQNHLVVLDPTGADHDWTGSPPAAWAPATVADAELVVCIDAHETTTTLEVCAYNGPDVTRIGVSRSVRVREARTGTEVAAFVVSDEPRTCSARESMDLTELRGYLNWPEVEVHLASMVDGGTFVDPDATPGPSGQATPRATVAPTSGPKRTPKQSSGPNSTPIAEPTPPPTTPTTDESAELRDAIARGLVAVSGTGDGLMLLDLKLTSKVDWPLVIDVGIGTVLEPAKGATQTMVVVVPKTISVDARSNQTVALDVLCMQMHDDQPRTRDHFTVRHSIAGGALLRLLRLPEFTAADGRVEQFAVWTITDNPPRGGYVALGSTYSIFGSGPSKAEFRAIRGLLEAAGLDPSHYRAFR